MLLPENGSVIIIDDKSNHAIPLISALSAYNIPSIYFDAKKESLPKEKISNARVVFLDINLIEGNQSWESERAALISSITSILTPRTPYILFIWSVNESAQFEDVIKLFEKELLEYKPIISPIPMGKDQLFKLIDPDTDTWELNLGLEKTIDFIQEKINSGISSLDALEVLIKWENLLSKAGSEVVNEMIELTGRGEKINDDLKNIFYKLAQAYWGNTISSEDPKNIATKSLITLNNILTDKIEYGLESNFSVSHLKEFDTKAQVETKVRGGINAKLLFSDNVTKFPLPGNLYLPSDDKTKASIINDLIDRSSFGIDYITEKNIEKKDFYEGPEIKKEHKKDFNSFSFKKVDEVVSTAVYFELEVTPICDYSQGNRIYCRLIPGVIIDEKYFFKKKRSAQYFYVSPGFLFKKNLVNFYCDLRHMKTIEPEKLNGIAPVLRIRHLFQSDIQSQLARHVSRPGVVFVQ